MSDQITYDTYVANLMKALEAELPSCWKRENNSFSYYPDEWYHRAQATIFVSEARDGSYWSGYPLRLVVTRQSSRYGYTQQPHGYCGLGLKRIRRSSENRSACPGKAGRADYIIHRAPPIPTIVKKFVGKAHRIRLEVDELLATLCSIDEQEKREKAKLSRLSAEIAQSLEVPAPEVSEYSDHVYFTAGGESFRVRVSDGPENKVILKLPELHDLYPREAVMLMKIIHEMKRQS